MGQVHVRTNSVRVRRESLEETTRRLETLVRRFERRYECSSQVMADATRSGLVKETAEISTWLSSYRVLKNLRRRSGASGRTAGTLTTTT